MGINLTQKSNRLLQSRRYTTDAIDTFQEAFTRVLDLGTSEVYSQTNLIPTSSLPFSGSSQDGATSGVIKYWYRFQMTPDSSRQVWMFIDPPQATSGIQLLNPNQLTNFISPKYIRADLGDNNTELSSGTGYKVVVSLGSNSTSATPITDESLFTFDYKTGVLQFASTPSAGNIYITAYQYIGRTLADNDTQGYSGSFSGSFQGDGAGLTNLPASSIVGLNLTQIADTTVSASVSAGTTSFQLISGSNTLFTVNNDGTITSAGSASFKDTAITGSLTVTQNLTVFGTASFTSVTSSQLFVSGSRILLHTNLPTVRFGGMEVIDDAATGTTGSLLWDSQNNHWVYANPSGSTYDGGGLMSGPRNTSGLGNETYPAKYSVLRGQGGDHLEGSNIYSTGSNITINKGATGSLDGVELLGDLEVTGSVRITAGASGSFSGSFQGDGDGLTNIPAASIVGLNLTQIADSNISASVSSTGTPFSVKNNTIPLFDVDGLGGITTYSTSSLQDITVTGSALVSGDIITQTSLTVSGSTILSGSSNIEGTTSISGSTTISGSVVIISDSEVTGSVNISGSTNTIGTSTVYGEMIVTGSLTVSGSSTLTNIGPAEFTGSTGVLGTLNVEGTSSIFGTSLVTGSTILSGSVDIEGPINSVGITTLTGSILTTGSIEHVGDLTTSGSIYVSSSLKVENQISASTILSQYSNIGLPEDGTYTDGLYTDITDSTYVGTMIDRFNEVLKGLSPSPAPDLDNFESITSGTNSLRLAFGAAQSTSSYTNVTGTGSLGAVNFTGTFSQANGAGGGKVRLGTFAATTTLSVRLNQDVPLNGTPFLNYSASAFNVPTDGGETYTLEVNGNTYSQATPGTGSLSSTYFVLTSADTGFFPATGLPFAIFRNRRGTVNIPAALWQNGWNYAKVRQGTNVTNYVDWVYDPAAASGNFPYSFNNFTTSSVVPTGEKALSGIKYYTGFSYIVTGSISNYYKNVYNTSNKSFSSVTSGVTAAQLTIPTPTTADDVIQVNSSHTLASSNQRLLSQTLSSTLSITNDFSKTGTTGAITTPTILLDNVNTANSNTVENFCLEDRRVPSASYDTQVSATNALGTFPSASDLGSSDLAVYAGTLRYPTRVLNSGNVSGAGIVYAIAGQPDYSSATGTRYFYRVFTNGASQLAGWSITLNGTSTSFVSFGTALTGNNMRIGIKVPGATGYRDMLTAAPGAGTYSPLADGVGCQSGGAISLGTAGALSLVSERLPANQVFVLRLEVGSSWTGTISSISITGF